MNPVQTLLNMISKDSDEALNQIDSARGALENEVI